MNTFLASNNAQTTLAGSITSTATTAALAPGSGALLPVPAAGQQFSLTFIDSATGLVNEIVYVTGMSGDNITSMLRAQEGTSGKAWLANDIATNLYTAGQDTTKAQITPVQNNAYSYSSDTGSANAYAITTTPTFTPAAGTIVGFTAANANTTASTFRLNSGTAYPIWGGAHAPLQGGEIANGYVELEYSPTLNAGAPVWLLIASTGGALQSAPAVASKQVTTAGQVVSGSLGTATAGGTANAITAAFPLAPTALVAGQPLTIIAAAANTLAVTAALTMGGAAAVTVPVVKGANQPLVAGDIPAAGYPIDANYSPAYGALVMQNPATGISSGAPQLLPLTASVASSLITASLAAIPLEYRNATLTTGSGITLSQAALSIAMPSIAVSLGATSGVATQIAVLSAYNAGSPVLCFENMSGGLDLSETGLISPTTISASATSASVIYSASAVAANTTYRVVGYLNATWTSGTGWTLSQVQPFGGQAMAAMQSFGMGQTWQDMTASRAASTTYYNTTSKTIFVSVTTSGSYSGGTFIVGGKTVATFSRSNSTVGTFTDTFPIPVPPGASYSCTAGVGTWLELR